MPDTTKAIDVQVRSENWAACFCARPPTLAHPSPFPAASLASQPGHYVSHLIGHESPGSLLSYLKARDWAEGLSAGAYAGSYGGFGFFNVRTRRQPPTAHPSPSRCIETMNHILL